MALTRADINRGYQDSRWTDFGYLNAREQASSANRRSAADTALLRLANRRHWTYDDLFENVLNARVGRVYGEWANDEFRSDEQLDTMLQALESNIGLTPGASSAFSKKGSRNLVDYTDVAGESAEQRFERNRRLEQEVGEVARRDDAERRLDARIRSGRPRRRGGFSLTQRSGRARYRQR